MNCLHCDYLLFGASEPRCPECGEQFEVTDYYFPHNAVHFLCPHCGQGYLGNDEYGLPRPRNFQCAKCRKHVTAASMIVKPVRGDALGEPLRFGNAWELRDRIGLFRGFVRAFGQITRRPVDFFRAAYATDRPGAMSFAYLCAFLAAPLLLFEADVLLRAFDWTDVLHGASLYHWSVFMVLFAGALVGVTVWTYAYSILVHMAFACTGRPHADFEGTAQVAAYACAALPAMVLPVVGIPWYFYIVMSGLRGVLDVSAARACVVTLLSVVILLVIAAGVAAYIYLQ